MILTMIAVLLLSMIMFGIVLPDGSNIYLRVVAFFAICAVAILMFNISDAGAKSCGDVSRSKNTAYEVSTSGNNCQFARESVARFAKKSARTHQKRKFRHNHFTLRCSWKTRTCHYHLPSGEKRTIRWLWEVPYNSSLASWYNDAGSTASGSHYTYGVAHKGYAFGTRVEFCYSGCVVGTVDDRGPFIAGREWDLNGPLKNAIGCPDLCYVKWRLRLEG